MYSGPRTSTTSQSLVELSEGPENESRKEFTVEDCCKGPVSWTSEFLDCGLGPKETCSLPRNLTQANLRMEENIKRYTGNYLVLAMVAVLCYLYKIPVALLDYVDFGSLGYCKGVPQLEGFDSE
ncbi:hypothetical protein R1sor_006893 [Riccia sorocarpa]|uniref:Uncharacterized protein n=1 Tax=Riccia sorocarpa TaxID=122646 RepID=A0ABD3HNU4_9MARC